MRILLSAAAGLILLGSCEPKNTAKNALPSKAPVAATDSKPATTALGDYEGTLGGKYPFRLAINFQNDKAELTGIYYYLSQQKPIRLWGFRAPDGEIWLREMDPEHPDTVAAGWGQRGKAMQPFAYFRLRPGGQGGLMGSWQAAKSGRQLPAQLRPYQNRTPVQKANVSEQTYFGEFTAPQFTVPDMKVTQDLYWLSDIETLSEQSLEELEEEHRNHAAGSYQGYGGIDSRVTYNNRGLLSVALRDEYTAANVNSRFWSVVVDLRTGETLETDEIDPARKAAFLAACNAKLQQQITAYLDPTTSDNEEQDSVDVAGLQSQRIGPDNPPDDMLIEDGKISFNHDVQYDDMSNFTRKIYAQQFRVEFTFAEMARFLKPRSPLRRLL
ncbi:hypothetical protein [Hymenobacter perfusus]|uniref:Uncharacterized protein n=1 Tax=Hymenobacter perfusus TaxID=1236770 RepID=A0A3R9N1N4_9BACT|nr:hypothetical protein [Hymenobacter perfusus]RSK45985.1 hypothetical protein EI293_02075 [Hymenobacter perfusus]